MTHQLLPHLLHKVQGHYLAYILTKYNPKIKIPQGCLNHLKAQEVEEERKVKVNSNHKSSLNHLPLPLSKKNSMKM